LTDEYLLAHEALSFTLAELETLAMAAFEHAFLPWPERVALMERVRTELASNS